MDKSGYIQSNSIMKLVLALKANAMPRRSLTRPTKVLYKQTHRTIKTKTSHSSSSGTDVTE